MAETTTVKDYFTSCFDKKLLIKKGIIAACALALILILSLPFYFWLKDKSGTPFGTNGFWYIKIVWNEGIAFGGLSGNKAAIYVIQSIMFIILLAVFLLVTHDNISASFITLAMFGGLFNLIQRAASGTDMVLDYFQFGFWKNFATFNWPDMGVVIGIFGFVISYIVQLIINRKEKPVKEQKQEG